MSTEVPEAGRRTPRLLVALGVLAALLVVGALGWFAYGLATRKVYAIASDSMAPSLHRGDRVNCGRRAPERLRRGEVVAFSGWPGKASPQTLVKRVVGLPGETVESRDGTTVTVNDAPLAEPYADGASGPAFGPVTVPDDAYFLVGDNRRFSADSRQHGPVPTSLVKGVCRNVVAPADRAGRIPETP